MRCGRRRHGNHSKATEPGLFDYEHRMKKLDRGLDLLRSVNAGIDWKIFRQDLERAVEKEARVSAATSVMMWLIEVPNIHSD